MKKEDEELVCGLLKKDEERALAAIQTGNTSPDLMIKRRVMVETTEGVVQSQCFEVIGTPLDVAETLGLKKVVKALRALQKKDRQDPKVRQISKHRSRLLAACQRYDIHTAWEM